jgi:hypothetical protein
VTSNAFHKLRDEIESSIVTGEFEPGGKTERNPACNRFGVSRTPIREALMPLSAIRLVEIRPRVVPWCLSWRAWLEHLRRGATARKTVKSSLLPIALAKRQLPQMMPMLKITKAKNFTVQYTPPATTASWKSNVLDCLGGSAHTEYKIDENKGAQRSMTMQ